MDNTVSDQFNLFIENYNKSYGCNEECQQKLELATLKQTYLDALNNLETAPQEVQKAYQAYLNFTGGTGAYQEYQQGSLQQDAANVANQYQINFDNNMSNAKILLSTYSGLYVNYNNIYDLSKIYQNENNDLQQELDINFSDTLTNDRKTFYENQATDSLQKYYWILSIIYTLVVIYYIISLIMYPTEYSNTIKVGCLLVLIIYPFISLWLSLRIISLYNYIVSLLPKNQYVNL